MTDPKPPLYPKLPYYDLSDHPELALALGRIAATWALVEHQLCNVLTALLRCPPQRGHAVYYAIINNSARIDMLRSIALDKTLDAKDRKTIMRLLERAQTAAGKRNGYIHKLWLLENNHVYAAETLSKDFPRGKKRKVHPPEIKKVIFEIRVLAHDVGEFLIDFTTRHPLALRKVDLHLSLQKKLP